MTIKITLITPPDIFENYNDSLLIANLTESEQAMASDWLGKFDSDKNFNIYFFQNETEMPWILHAMATAKYKYINVDKATGLTGCIAGYILGKPNTYYSCKDLNAVDVYRYINPNRVADVAEFFERTLGAEK